MGLFSFVKEAGRRLGIFGDRAADEVEEAKAAAAAAEGAEAVAADIKAAILSYVEAAKLGVHFDPESSTVTLNGQMESQADAERAVLIAGNTEGVGSVEDQIVIKAPAPPAVHHTVVSGDSLSELSKSYYGVIHLYDAIFEANQPMLADPDEIYPGQVLRIPPVRPPVHTVEKGETLGTIADHWYGDAKRYTTIYEANQDKLSSPDEIEIGQQLKIPLVDPKVAPLA
ncbi:MAG: peptidoglycan-binding protein LysM [Myxococcota bacterium]